MPQRGKPSHQHWQKEKRSSCLLNPQWRWELLLQSASGPLNSGVGGHFYWWEWGLDRPGAGLKSKQGGAPSLPEQSLKVAAFCCPFQVKSTECWQSSSTPLANLNVYPHPLRACQAACPVPWGLINCEVARAAFLDLPPQPLVSAVSGLPS